MTADRIFEELRFIWELLAAEFVFLLPFAQRRKHFGTVSILGILLFSVLAFGFFVLLKLDVYFPPAAIMAVIGSWYIVLALATMCFTRFCFRLTICDALYICIAGYSVQHIVYFLVHELLAQWIFPALQEHLILYALISFGTCAVLLRIFYGLFAEKLRQCSGQLFLDTPVNIMSHVILLTILIICTFSCQFLFQSVEGAQYLSVQLGVMVCLLMLGVQYWTLSAVQTRQERTVIEQMLQNSAKQYSLSKEMVDHIQRTCHDLKHNLQVLKTIDSAARQAYIEEAERNIALYHELVHTDNEVLNTILGEKCLFCRSRGIQLTCAVDGGKLDFVSVPDLYAILGNAIDNVIECVDRFDDPGKRIISLTVTSHNAFTCIQTNNYCDHKPRMMDGLPLTTKANSVNHGFGLKSIRYLAEKYGGSMVVGIENNVFTLQIMLPEQ